MPGCALCVQSVKGIISRSDHTGKAGAGTGFRKGGGGGVKSGTKTWSICAHVRNFF